jgi:gamma-tubulin complex component 3
MIFFIRQLQYYCHLEVIGCSWQVLEDFAIKKEGDLDSLIEAHRMYLDRLVTKALLMSARKSSRREVRVAVFVVARRPWLPTDCLNL